MRFKRVQQIAQRGLLVAELQLLTLGKNHSKCKFSYRNAAIY
ncbi:hypothetical protein VST7929_02871 [Vibrio stylophorae]|uniref:Uncharacterized protein n=1 Tax=Vibrio stylophorae TaxID=659351 RepID=A0ABN8DV65_9VIBR|nr:hypothetical protein VST7929_02871 [Vibrio stylophorae]